MVLLKKYTLLLGLLFAVSFGFSQTQSQLQAAFSQSYTHESAKNYSKAISALEAVYLPDSYEMNLRLGWLYHLAGNPAKSITYYSKASALMPAATEPLWGILTPYADKADWANVEKTYVKILSLDPKNSVANYNMGLIFYYRKNYSRAKKYFDITLNLYPFDYDAMVMSAWNNYYLGNMKEAKILFQKALLNRPNSTSALEGLSLIK